MIALPVIPDWHPIHGPFSVISGIDRPLPSLLIAGERPQIAAANVNSIATELVIIRAVSFVRPSAAKRVRHAR